MKLFHVHNPGYLDELYEVGNTITIGELENKLRLDLLKEAKRYASLIRFKMVNGSLLCDRNGNLITVNDIPNLSEYDQALLCYRIYGPTFDNMKDIRELVLEEIRSMYYPEKPSRYTCMWLTDEDSLIFWKNMISPNAAQIFEMDVSGKLFASTNELLPWIMSTPEEMQKKGYNYWNPTNEDLKGSRTKEYLFEGKARVLRRIQ